MNLNVLLGQLCSIPIKQFPVMRLEIRSGGCNEDTAELAAFFIDDRGMIALLQNQCGFHAADTAADDGNGFLY